MNVVFTARFAKDVRNIHEKAVKEILQSTIDRMQVVTQLDEIGDVIKMNGAKNAFRVRIGEFRLGFFFDRRTINPWPLREP